MENNTQTMQQPNWNNKEFVLQTVKQNGWYLRYASDELCADKTIVLTAVQNDGTALECASDKLRADKTIVLTAVRQNKRAFEYASNDLQADDDVALAAGILVIINSNKIKIKSYRCAPCHLEIFKINGIEADANDFGDDCDHDDGDDNIQHVCQCHYFEANREPENIKKCIEKYHLSSEQDYLNICDLLEDTLYVGRCGLCD